MAAADPTQILKRNDALVDQRRLWEPAWQQIGDLFCPRKSGLQWHRVPGDKVERQFKSIGIQANNLLASTMNGSLTSGVLQWFRLKLRDPKLNAQQEVAEWLEDFGRRLFLAFQQSNFTAEMPEVYQDLGAFGTGCIFMDERRGTKTFGGFRFQAQEIGTYAISEDEEGNVDTVYRTIKMSRRAVIRRFGAKKVHPSMLEMVQNDPTKADELVEIVHGVYPRDDYSYSGDTRKLPAKKLPYASCYVDRDNKHLLEESGFHEFRFQVPRWSKVTGETWGRGPGFTARASMLTLNKSTELNLKLWAKVVDPIYKQRHDGVVGTPKMQPGSLITLYDMDALEPLDTGAAKAQQFTMIEREALEAEIKDIFFWNQLQLPGGQMYTATEVERRLELMQRIMGPTLGRLNSELLEPQITTGAAMMLRAGVRSNWQDPGAAPMPPPAVAELLAAGAAEVDIEYEGPLARSQKTVEVEAVTKFVNIVAPIKELDPDALDGVKLDKIVEFTYDRVGLPPELKNSEEEKQTIRDGKAKAREEQAQMEKAGGMADIAGRMAPAMTAMQGAGMTPGQGGEYPAE